MADLSHTALIDVNTPSSVLPPTTLTIVLGRTVDDPTVIDSTVFFPAAGVQSRRAILG